MSVTTMPKWTNLVQKLQNERARLVARAIQSDVTRASNEPRDDGDQAKIYEDREAYWINQRVLENQIQTIDHILQQIALGKYGICQGCHKPIDPARLEAMPYALYCVVCQEKNERKNRSVKPHIIYRN